MKAIHQGDIYWAPLEAPNEFIHPHVVIQENATDPLVVVCALTTNRKRANLPGNILLEVGEANLPKQSIIVVSQVSTLQKSQLGEYIGSLSQERISQLLAGMRFVQELTKHHG